MSVVVLTLRQRLQQVLAPFVIGTLGVRERVFAEGVHGLGEGVVVVVQAALLLAGVLVEGVVPPHPVHRPLDARVVLIDAGVQEALQAAVGHRAGGAQAALGGLVGVLVGVGRVVDQAAPVAVGGLLGEGLVVGLAGQVLAAADELHRLDDGGVVARHAGGDQGVDEELRVGHVGPALGAVADAAEL